MLHLVDFTPFPDEIFYSIVSRYLRRNGIEGGRRNLELLFSSPDDTNKIKRLELKNFLLRLNKKELPEQLKYLNETTLLPIEELWRGEESIVKVAQHRMGRWVSPFCGFRYQFCPDCIVSDVEQYGVAYWHRIHQVDGVVICPEHRIILRKPVYNEEDKSYRYYFNISLPSDFIGQPHNSSDVIDRAIFTESSWVINRHAAFSDYFLNIDYDLSKYSYWALIKSVLVEKKYGNPKSIEMGKFYRAWLPYLEALEKLDSKQVSYALYSQKRANNILLENSYPSCVIALVAFLFETPEKFISKLSSKTSEIDLFKEINSTEKKKIASLIDKGCMTDEIADELLIEPIDAWAVTRHEHLVPNDFIFWLSESIMIMIEKHLLDYYDVDSIAEELRIEHDELLRLIILTPGLRDAYKKAKENGLMVKNKERIKDMAITNWPCKFSQVKKLLPDICEWVSARAPSWIQKFERCIDIRTRSHKPTFITEFKVKEYYEEILEKELFQQTVRTTDVTKRIASNCAAS